MSQKPQNNTTRLILERRSAREDFSNQPVPRDVVDEIVRCGLAAPSSKNARPWRFHVVTDRKCLRELADAVDTASGAETYVPHDPKTGKPRTDWSSTVALSANVLRSVPLAIFVENTGPFSRGRQTLAAAHRAHLPVGLFGYCLEMVGIGAAVMNMWIAANSLGIQASFLGDVCIAERTIATRLGIDLDLVGVLAMGYNTATPPPKRYGNDHEDIRVVWHEET